MVSALANKINSSFERDHTVEWEVSQTDGLIGSISAGNKQDRGLWCCRRVTSIVRKLSQR